MFHDILHMEHRDNILSHLGVSLDIQQQKNVHFNFLIDVLSQKLLSWSSLLLSMSTTVILINIALIAMISHFLSSFAIPITITYCLDSMIIAIIWSNKDRSGIHWVKKEGVHLPKSLGGLGVRSLHILNKVFLMKTF